MMSPFWLPECGVADMGTDGHLRNSPGFDSSQKETKNFL